MFRVSSELLVASIFPRVENPWPDTIGLGFPFAMAGALGVLASALYADAEEDRRDRAIRRGGLLGFRIGAAFYVVSFAVQVAFGS